MAQMSLGPLPQMAPRGPGVPVSLEITDQAEFFSRRSVPRSPTPHTVLFPLPQTSQMGGVATSVERVHVAPSQWDAEPPPARVQPTIHTSLGPLPHTLLLKKSEGDAQSVPTGQQSAARIPAAEQATGTSALHVGKQTSEPQL